MDDDTLEAARELAAARKQSLGRVVSKLMRRGLPARETYPAGEDGLPVFGVAEDNPPIGLDDVNRDEDDPA